jgi:hypothetical protein
VTRYSRLTLDDLLEVIDGAGLLEDVVEAGDLNEPAYIVGEELVLDDPLGELVPLVLVPAMRKKRGQRRASSNGDGNSTHGADEWRGGM